MGADDLFLKIKFNCEKCGREFETKAITAELWQSPTPWELNFKNSCPSCGCLCTAITDTSTMARRFEKALEGVDVPEDLFGERLDKRKLFHWWDFCIKGSKIYEGIKNTPEFSELGAISKIQFEKE